MKKKIVFFISFFLSLEKKKETFLNVYLFLHFIGVSKNSINVQKQKIAEKWIQLRKKIFLLSNLFLKA
jgi:hypothetical protein